jgi:hypothetical protein
VPYASSSTKSRKLTVPFNYVKGASATRCVRDLATLDIEDGVAEKRYRQSYQWTALTLYVNDGGVEIDNNSADQALRAVALGRKNFLHVAICTLRGGRRFGNGCAKGLDAASFEPLEPSCHSFSRSGWEGLERENGYLSD